MVELSTAQAVHLPHCIFRLVRIEMFHCKYRRIRTRLNTVPTTQPVPSKGGSLSIDQVRRFTTRPCPRCSVRIIHKTDCTTTFSTQNLLVLEEGFILESRSCRHCSILLGLFPAFAWQDSAGRDVMLELSASLSRVEASHASLARSRNNVKLSIDEVRLDSPRLTCSPPSRGPLHSRAQ